MALSELDHALDEAIAQITAAGGPLEVGRATVRGVDYPVFAKAPPSLRAFFEMFLPAHLEKEFLVYQDERLTFADVRDRAVRIAAVLQHGHGIAKGDRVAIAMRNYPEWIAAFMGAQMLGAVVVPMNAWWKSEELSYGLKDSGTRLVIADEERLRRIREIEGLKLPVIAVRTGHAVAAELGAVTLEDALAETPPEPWYLPPIEPEDDATIMYTSGSTGAPKGAVSTHRGIVSGTLNYLVQGLAMLALAQRQGLSVPPQQVMLLNVPLFHITGLVPVFLVSVAIGRKMIIMYRWDAGEALRLIEKERCTYFVGVPTMSLELMQHPDRDKYDLSSLVDIAGGGAPRPPEHVERLAQAFPGKNPAIGYGLTETNGVGAGNLRDNYRRKPASTGRPSKPLVEMMIVDEAMNPVPTGEVGEVCIRSAANVRGYWMKPLATEAAFTKDGWFRTGDLGRFDEDGYLYIVDRKKDIIIRGGENISAVEVEAAIYAHPAVAEASVFGLPDERLGEIVGAVVFPRPGERLEGEAIIQFVARDLAAFKVPARVWVVNEPLPKLGSGKIDKVRLRSHYREVHLGRVTA
ncbi:MAG: acyl--CoA ligase [Sphingomonadaceae bacterium]|uniref:class I adenylate-forming enzyme family protein n=1 Tax=Thermaurantiacus sp. TaxID=2820283 RepID=UPI00298EF2DD|nr:class I adenylate-forming enzyme family protein [Thermaurantiacus sp.]MCS6987642.1 acyl--CoA ligase [Sphingomonadaceae bacterium]MDW8415243.1 class I adenylate-forming enzyme family protein [Thermaurantiacus sp.]